MVITGEGVHLQKSDYIEAIGKSLIVKVDLDSSGKIISAIKKIIKRDD